MNFSKLLCVCVCDCILSTCKDNVVTELLEENTTSQYFYIPGMYQAEGIHKDVEGDNVPGEVREANDSYESNQDVDQKSSEENVQKEEKPELQVAPGTEASPARTSEPQANKSESNSESLTSDPTQTVSRDQSSFMNVASGLMNEAEDPGKKIKCKGSLRVPANALPPLKWTTPNPKTSIGR